MVAQFERPGLFHGPRPRTALSTDDRPVDAGKIDRPTGPINGSNETNFTDARAAFRCLMRTAFFASSTETPSQICDGAKLVGYR